ncbi:lactococcin 972 family bacteriocin [Microbacterium bovistercoris]|uniref:Lactococcin 972 family bacteriocin n=1 Tax=Microbacterium bovistercoris TaxID=2293570 RepID=A0A371NWP9_9MICO|nr:lactococcin 972 family bacteriocin [Microbacterium bovistercoris]REJ06381.1 lactococcin 972 family bacteriocin [Microbacterium bovistercoris]
MTIKKTLIRLGVSAGLASALVLGSAVAASATIAYPSGGIWSYGVSDRNYSDFFHGADHRSSVSNANGLVRSGRTSGNVWSYASQAKTLSGNKAYWYVY